VNGNRGDPELLAGPEDAKGDLAAVGYEDLVEHVVLQRMASGKWRVGKADAIRWSLFPIGVTQ
jgi:hypothetical protein